MKVALTGSIAAGKSSVLGALARLGWLTVSADLLVAEIARSKEGICFRRCLMGGDFKKADFARKFMADESMRRRWLDFVLPRVNERWKRALADNPDANVVIELPLLFENRLERYFDKVIVLNTSEGVARKRWKTDGRDLVLFDSLTSFLLPMAHKLARADFVLTNEGCLEQLLEQVRVLHIELIYKNVKRSR